MNKHHRAVATASRAIKSKRPVSSQSKVSGFSLVEILVSIVVLSFGLLGMVGLQATALQANRDSRIQSSAVSLARELGELMRSNKDVGIAITAAANPYLIDYDNSTSSPATVASATINCFTGNCSAATKVELAEFEVQDWLTRLNANLPGAKVIVCFDSTPFDTSGVPQWACTNSGGLAVIKIGWTVASTNRTNTGTAAFQKASVPSVVLPVTAGSST